MWSSFLPEQELIALKRISQTVTTHSGHPKNQSLNIIFVRPRTKHIHLNIEN